MYLNGLLADQLSSSLFRTDFAPGAIARGAAPECDDPCSFELATGWRSWLRAYGLGGQVDGDGNAQRFVYSFAGLLGGVERRLGDSTRVGVVAGYNHTNANFRGVAGTADGDGLIAGLYGTQTFGTAHLIGAATYGYTGYDTRRIINFAGVNRVASGSVNQDDLSGYLEAGYTQCAFGWVRLQPLLAAQYFYLNQRGFTETGAGALNLDERSQATRALWGMAGARVFLPFDSPWGVFTPQLHARYVHDFIGENQFVAGSLAGAGGSFLVKGAGMGRNFVVAGGGLSVECTSWLKLTADYTLQSSDSQTSHTGSGAVQVQW